jgi:hypothetical protein
MEESSIKFQHSFREVSTSFRIAQKICKDRYKELKGLKYELSLSKEFKELLRESSKLKEAIIGLLIFDLQKLLRRLEQSNHSVKLFKDLHIDILFLNMHLNTR